MVQRSMYPSIQFVGVGTSWHPQALIWSITQTEAGARMWVFRKLIVSDSLVSLIIYDRNWVTLVWMKHDIWLYFSLWETLILINTVCYASADANRKQRVATVMILQVYTEVNVLNEELRVFPMWKWCLLIPHMKHFKSLLLWLKIRYRLREGL